MNYRLSSSDIQQLVPTLGSVARLVAGGSQLSDSELRTILLGADLSSDPRMLEELKLWGRLLKELHGQPTPERRLATVEALTLRNLPEASILLAVDAVAGPKPVRSSSSSVAQRLVVNPPQLDFGMLGPGQAIRGWLDVQGGPGQIVVESDQLRVRPLQFPGGATRVQVEVRPLTSGILWTPLKFITAGETVEVPVLAQWAETPVAPSSPPPPISPPKRPPPGNGDLAALVDQAIFSSGPVGNAGGGQAGRPAGGNPRPGTSPDPNAEVAEQIRRLLG